MQLGANMRQSWRISWDTACDGIRRYTVATNIFMLRPTGAHGDTQRVLTIKVPPRCVGSREWTVIKCFLADSVSVAIRSTALSQRVQFANSSVWSRDKATQIRPPTLVSSC